MYQYLITCSDGDWFDFHYNGVKEILRPAHTPSRHIDGWGSNRILVEDEEIVFRRTSGDQVIFETGNMPQHRADQIIEESCQNIEAETGQRAEAVQASF